MKKFIFISLTLLSFQLVVNAGDKIKRGDPVACIARIAADPEARCDSMWVDFDVTENNQFGMFIHFRFTTFNMKDSDGYVFAKFNYADGRVGELKDQNGKYNTNHGGTATTENIKPRYTESNFDNFTLFMPYSELEIKPGKYELVIESKIMLNSGTVVAYLPFYSFSFTKGK